LSGLVGPQARKCGISKALRGGPFQSDLRHESWLDTVTLELMQRHLRSRLRTVNGASMSELSTDLLLKTDTLALRDIVCAGRCRHRSDEEFAQGTCLVFPYRGVYVRHVGRSDAVAEANQVLFFNHGEGYRISHPVAGGDACLSLAIGEGWLSELTPREHVYDGIPLTFRRPRLRIDARTQALVALLRHSLRNGVADTLEGETLLLTLVRRAVGGSTSSHPAGGSFGRQKLVDRAKLVLSSDPGRRWTLAAIAAEVRVSPVYLTQVFQQVEGMPLYRYQLRLRLSRALHLLEQCDDLGALSLELGFSSHSHFTSAFRQVYERTPLEFQRSLSLR
jgi:AraC-like DNA-binding protein